jgi:hypothetical protein
MKNARRHAFVVAVVVLMLLGSFGISYAITNGQPDGNAHPYVGLVVFDVEVPGVGFVPAWRCSGALLSPTVFLTAGHCTDGADAARVWFDEVVQGNTEYPFGGSTSTEGTPYTMPGYGSIGPGLPGFDFHDVGVVVLDEPVVMAEYAELPDEGLVDTLKGMTDVDLVGYGVQEQLRGGGPPYWTGLKVRLYAPAQLVPSKHVHSSEFIKITLNPGKDQGGLCFGDSGGPDLLGGTDTVLAVNAYVTSYNCTGVGYSNRIDTADALDFINPFLD